MMFTIDGLDYTIRDSKDEDYDFVYNLLKTNMYDAFMKHWGGWNPESFKKEFIKRRFKIVECAGEKVAFYDLGFKEGFSYVFNIQIVKSMQRKGLGKFLIGLIEKETKKHELNKIRLKVFEDNFAKDFYLDLGFKEVRVEGTSVVLEKDL
ncbi:GNAT family N-acetyltransferase [Nanoarchaeota archaeon]